MAQSINDPDWLTVQARLARHFPGISIGKLTLLQIEAYIARADDIEGEEADASIEDSRQRALRRAERAQQARKRYEDNA